MQRRGADVPSSPDAADAFRIELLDWTKTRRRVGAHGRHAGGAMRILRMLALALVAAAPAGAAVAQYPERPVTMIVPFPPGGVADTVARPVAEALGAALKQPV